MSRFTRPEFAWPAAVVSLLLLGAVVTFGVLYFSRIDGGPRVIDDYYRRGVAWDSVASVMNRIDRLGWTVDVDLSPAPDAQGRRWVHTTVRDASGNGVEGLALSISAYRPTDVQASVSAAADDSTGGRYVAPVVLPVPGLWDLEVAGTVDGEPFVVRVRREAVR